MRAVDLDAFRGWLQRYFDAWASNDPVRVSALFAEDAVYSYGPFREETRGRRYEVADVIGRWRIEGRWWADGRDREYWRVEARGGAVWDLYHDRHHDRWHMERLWD